MELPEDVLTIVRAYAKPRFTYFREYNGITKLLGREWIELKEKLQTDPEPILPEVLAYQDALSSQIKFNQEWVSSQIKFNKDIDARRTLNWPQYWELQRRNYELGVYLRKDAEDRFWALTRLLYSKGSFYNHIHFIHPMV